MFQFIPLDEKGISIIKNIDSRSKLYLCGCNTYKQLWNYENYPIKTRNLAIKNILEFLNYIDNLPAEDYTVAVHTNKIRKIFTGGTYTLYLRILSELKIISRVPYPDGKYYEKMKKCCKYYLHPTYRNDKPGIVIVKASPIRKLIADKKYPVKFERAVRLTECDYTGAITAEYNNYLNTGMGDNNLRVRLSRLFALLGERRIKKGKNVDRVYCSFSNLSKISRAYLYIDNSKYHCIDIRNCQPLLLSYLLRHLGLSLDDNYVVDCENAIIYERFVNEKYKDKEAVKEPLYSAIYFAFKPKKDIAQKFKEVYPLTYNSLEILHREEVTMASRLQNLEASIFSVVVPKKSKYYFTLFDAIYYTDISDKDDLKLKLTESFARYNLSPKFSE
jgi:hypothetical protein